MLTKKAALDLVTDVWNTHQGTEVGRLNRIDQALKVDPPVLRREFVNDTGGRHRYAGGFTPTVAIPDDAPPIMWELARKSRTNYLPLLVRVYRQALRVEGYVTAAPTAQNPWRWWQANRMDARAGGLHDSALKYGTGYLSVLPGDQGPATRAYTPRRMTAAYQDPEVDEWPMFAAHVDTSESHLVLTDEEAEYRFGIEDAAAVVGLAGMPSLSRRIGSDAVTYIEARRHDVGVCPVVRYRDSFLLDGEEQFGIVEPLMVIQERIDETSFGQLVAQYFAAFKQRAVIGWVPESEAEELKAGAARIWYLDVDKGEVDIKELNETDLTRYIDSGRAARRDFAALGQIPVAISAPSQSATSVMRPSPVWNVGRTRAPVRSRWRSVSPMSRRCGSWRVSLAMRKPRWIGRLRCGGRSGRRVRGRARSTVWSSSCRPRSSHPTPRSSWCRG